MDIVSKQEMIAGLINEGEKEKAIQLLLDWSKQTGFKDVIFSVLEPMLTKSGKLWMQGKLSLAHGYLSGKVAEEFYILASQDPEFLSVPDKRKGTVILGNIEDDFHPLGRRLVNIFTKASGWNVIDLGTDVPAGDFIEKAIEHEAEIIAVSAMMFTTARNILKIREELDRRSLSGSIKLAVGGAVFKLRPGLQAEVGGDGTAETAMGASDLFDRLVKSIHH